MFFWFSYVPIAAMSLYRVVRNRNLFVEKLAFAEKNVKRVRSDAAIIFQITTRSATKTHVVRRGIQSIIDSAKKTEYRNFHISIVTDDPDDIRTLEGVNCEVVVVNKNFKTNAIRKGRALQYAVEHRRRIGMNTSKHWIFHMDDESYVTTQTIVALLKSIESGKEVASEGPIFYPLKFEAANRLTAIAESIRPFACYDCVSQMTNPPPLHMHGSNLLIRSDIEDTIEWKFGPTLAEDQMFGYKVYEKYGPGSMGWHGGMLLEQPPLNIKDHFFQRRRWVLGTLQNLQNFPRWHRYKLMYKSVTYFLGFASAVASTAIMLYSSIPTLIPTLLNYNTIGYYDFMSLPDKLPSIFFNSIFDAVTKGSMLELSASTILLFTSIVWLGSYQLGLFLNLKYSKIEWRKRVMFHLQTLLVCPIIGLVETFPAFWAMIEYNLKKKDPAQKTKVYDFYVVNK
ncbi:glycosyl transferase [Candidatus Nitrososphaera evergladensis SR1]|uniref:Glycosyl transferase n=2 Tax=Nitrososphaera TaxID=497726 RepID=A0A075MTY8_9ARCH|nr:glycosyl transferase [Candidatus Nitrososphaera evergladensis SR1]